MTIENRLAGMNFVSADEITPDVMEYVMKKSAEIEDAIRAGNVGKFMLAPEGAPTIIAKAFAENSTRTRISFDTAALLIGAKMIGFDGEEGTSLKKKESLRDTLEMLAGYGAKAIIMRHPLNGAARWATEVMERRARRVSERYSLPFFKVPILNGGDGTHEHPTQLILDRFAVLKENGRLTEDCDHAYSVKGLTFLISGDMVYGRVPHSLVKNFSQDGCNFIFVAPEEFQMPEEYLRMIDRNNSTYEQVRELNADVLGRADAIWGLRFQTERHKGVSSTSLERALRNCRITLADLRKYAKKTARVYHPLPINKEDPEIDPAINDSEFGVYYEEAAGGVPTRLVELGISLGLIGEDFEGEVYTPPKQGSVYWKETDRVPKQDEPGKYSVKPIEGNGTTIDRLPVDSTDDVMNMLGLANRGMTYRGGNVNPHSERVARKGLLMIEGWQPSEEELVKIGMVGARREEDGKPLTVNFIDAGVIVKKVDVYAPGVVVFEGQGSCADHDCVSRDHRKEHAITKVVREGPGEVRCWYCDTIMPTDRLF